MKRLLPLLSCSLFLAVHSAPAPAVSIHKCEDDQGNVTYQDRCPPGTSSVGEKQYRVKGGAGDDTASPSGPLTLYVVPDCDSCKQVEEFLAVRGISVQEKNVDDDVDLQNELKEVAGDLRVPALVVNDDVIVGYDRGALISALSKAGYQTEVDLND